MGGNQENTDKNGNNTSNNIISSSATNSQQVVKTMFHDFLGNKGISTTDNKTLDVSTSVSIGGASSGGGGGRAPPLSTTSDLASERQVGNHLEGIPFYGPRSEVSVHEIANRLIGGKRSNSDSAFAGSTRDGVPQMSKDSLESLPLMKMLKTVGGGDRARRSSDDGFFYGMQSMRPCSSASLILQPSAGSNRDASVSKWDQSIPTGTAVNYPPHGSQLVPFAHQVSTNRFRDNNPVPSIISQPAADEGSRTGIKGPGILSSINSGSGTLEKHLSTSMPSGSKLKSGSHYSELESLTPSRTALALASHQMTIFYGGQAHVFDDVHPNKADVIMALAGSNGGSWTTTYSPKPTTTKFHGESYTTSREHNDTSGMPNVAFHREVHRRLSGTSNAAQGIACGDLMSLSTGSHCDGIVMNKDTRRRIQSGEAITEDKRD